MSESVWNGVEVLSKLRRVRLAARSTRRAIVIKAALAFVVAATAMCASAQVEYVDTTIGNVGILLVPTRPAVYLPNSMIRVYPMRADAMDDRIDSFPLTINSHRIQELFSLMPGEDGAPASWDQETTTPYYYSVCLGDSRIQTEFSATERCGYFRLTFPSGKASLVLANRLTGDLRVQGNAVVGEERFNDMAAYVYGEFSAPLNSKLKPPAARSRLIVTGSGTSPGPRVLEFRYGISFISVEQAKKNLNREIPAWGFERVKDAARTRWNETLGQIAVEGGTEAQRRVFYTALYRCFERMINITEDGRYYSAFDHKVHEDARPFYVDNWLWDTFPRVGAAADAAQSGDGSGQDTVLCPHVSAVGSNADVRHGFWQLRMHERQSRRAVVCGCMVQGRAEF